MMKGMLAVLFLLLHSVPNVFGQTAAQLAIIAAMPSCGLVCLETAVLNSTCGITDTTCICGDNVLLDAVTVCVTASCTVKNALSVKNASSTLCDVPIRDRRTEYNIVSNTLGTISGATVAVRIGSKLMLRAPIELDDWFIMATLAAGIPSTIMTVHGMTSNGLGKDIWTLKPVQITNFIHTFYAIEILYFAQVAIMKLSLLAFYARIFPAPKIRKIIYATALVDLVYGTVFVIMATFQCQPVSFYWKNWDGEHTGTCLNVNNIGWANAVISIALDLWMIGIPLSQLYGLQLHWKKKFGVMIMFLVGTFVTVISAIRLQGLVNFANSANPTWDNFETGLWSTVEINIGIICCCLPNIRLLLVRLFPKYLGSTQGKDTKNYMSNQHSQVGGNISINRGKKLGKNGELSVSSNSGIQTSHTYTVQYGSEHDGDSLELMDIEAKGGQTRVAATSF